MYSLPRDQSLMAIVMVISLLTGMVSFGQEKTPPSHGKPSGPILLNKDAGRDRMPSGPEWPICWDFQFSKPDPTPQAEPFTARVSIKPLLFDVSKVRLIPATGGKLKLSDVEEWRGTLKKGEAKKVNLGLTAPVAGDNGSYGVIIVSSNFYSELRAYVSTREEGPYAKPVAKAYMLEQIDKAEEHMPVYEIWAGGTITVDAGEGR